MCPKDGSLFYSGPGCYVCKHRKKPPKKKKKAKLGEWLGREKEERLQSSCSVVGTNGWVGYTSKKMAKRKQESLRLVFRPRISANGRAVKWHSFTEYIVRHPGHGLARGKIELEPIRMAKSGLGGRESETTNDQETIKGGGGQVRPPQSDSSRVCMHKHAVLIGCLQKLKSMKNIIGKCAFCYVKKKKRPSLSRWCGAFRLLHTVEASCQTTHAW